MSQGSVATANRWGGQISNYLIPNFLRVLCAKNDENMSIFDDFIAKIKRVTFFLAHSVDTGVRGLTSLDTFRW